MRPAAQAGAYAGLAGDAGHAARKPAGLATGEGAGGRSLRAAAAQDQASAPAPAPAPPLLGAAARPAPPRRFQPICTAFRA